MITASAVLVLVGAVLLVLGLLDARGGLGLLYGAIATCVAAAALLVVGVFRQRPRPGGALAGGPPAWSGARPGDRPAEAQAGDVDDAARLDAALASVPEVGPRERDALLEHFGGYRWVRIASVEALADVPGITPQVAARVHDRLRGW